MIIMCVVVVVGFFFGFVFKIPEYDLCPCFVLPESFKSAIGTMLDVSLLKDPVFMLIGISNMFGMAGLYVPFVYLVDAASLNVSEVQKAKKKKKPSSKQIDHFCLVLVSF